MSFINYNGKIVPSNSPIIQADNRSLRYGDGLFETIKFKNDQLILLDEHLSRLWQGLKAFQFEVPKLFNPDFLESEILRLLQKNNLKEARVRLTVIRGNGGLFDPEKLSPDFIIQTWPLNESNGKWNENGLVVSIYEDIRKSQDRFSNLKHNNFLPYLMGALYAKQEKSNDALILNQLGNLCDSTIANLFIIQDGDILTPPLSEGCIAGTMRNWLIRQTKNTAFEILEKPICLESLLQADEVFLTNSIYNLRWVAAVQNKSYAFSKTLELFHFLKQTNPKIFC